MLTLDDGKIFKGKFMKDQALDGTLFDKNGTKISLTTEI